MDNERAARPIDWYRIPIDRQLLAELTVKSDLRGGLQTGGFLAVLAATGTLALWSASHWPWYATLACLFLHGTGWSFLSNGFHEFSHGTVFRTRSLNRAFLALFSILSGNNPVLFWESHTEHHKFTMYPGQDYEVLPNADSTLGDFLLEGFVNVRGVARNLAMTLRHSIGWIRGDWEEHLFPPNKPGKRAALMRWARILLATHGAILALSLWMRWWMLPVVVSLAPYYGRALQWLCNQSQHAGLPGSLPDFRLCSRTIHLNPVLAFLYWYMNFHTEHHLFAAVPCYRLKALNHAVREDLPPCPTGLVATWREITAIARARARVPGYRFLADVPPRRARGAARAR